MFSPDQWLASTGVSFYNGVATQSLRLDDGSSAFLSRTPSSAGNRKTWTWSGWLKRGFLGGSHGLIESTSISFGLYLDKLFITVGGVGNGLSTSVFRDSSAWYHVLIAFDTTQASSADRVKFYVNGTQHSLDNTLVSQNTDYNINNTTLQRIGVTTVSGSTTYIDGYLSEVNFIDGSALAPTSFGETKNGVWIAKEYTGSYGTNGFRLQFNQTGTGTASASTIGADTSGNTNHFTSSGIVASDCAMPDSPENNWCLPSKIAMGGSSINQPLHQKGMLKITGTTTAWRHTRGTFPFRNGKWYFEGRISIAPSGTQGYALGICDPALPTNDDINSGTPPHKFYGRQHTTKYNNDSGTGSAFPATTAGTIVGIAIDMDNGKMWTSDDGTWYNNNNASTTLDPDNPDWTGITVGTSGDYVTNQIVYNTSMSIVLNYGQDSSFTGLETATSNADANGNGTFHSAVPSGFLSLCSANLPEPTISPNTDTQADDYFNTVLWTGNATDDRSITGVGFQPDWTWVKKRAGDASVENHWLVDSNRGVTKHLSSNLSDGEFTFTNVIQAFESNGFQIGTDGKVNRNNDTYVGWNWKANGGTTSSNTDGSITSTVQANTDAGFSIVTYTGTGSLSTVGHSLGVKPSMMIIKNRDDSDSGSAHWLVYHEAIGATHRIKLDSTEASGATSVHFNNTEPTSSVFTINTSNAGNGSGDNLIAYCFADIEGYSKFGSYTGNGNVDGTFVYTGFRPAWVMTKSTTISANWTIIDTTRKTFNLDDARVHPDLSDGEYSNDGYGWDMLSNGFKHRTSVGTFNSSGTEYIYMAFAESPFKYANAR